MTGLLLDLDLATEQRFYAETILSSAEVLLTLVNDILDFSKIEAGKLDLESIQFDLGHLVQKLERLLSASAKNKQLKLLRSISPELMNSHFIGDPTRIGQVLANLISNAIKFTEKGQITIEITSEIIEEASANDVSAI
jgi:signal transduction histidine kinase